METLSKFQHSILKRLANGPVKTYCCPCGIAADKRCDDITEDFNAMLRLAQIGIVNDVSDLPKYAGVIKEWQDEGRYVVIININGFGQEMFQRTVGDKWVN